jgi:predicted transcriptional regulator
VRYSFWDSKVSFSIKYYKKHNFWTLLAYNSKVNQPKLLIELIQMSEEQKSGLGGFVSGLQQKAGEVAENIKEKAEDVIGEENSKKVSDVLNTDVGVIARDSAGKAVDGLEKLTGRDIDGDGDIAGKPKV